MGGHTQVRGPSMQENSIKVVVKQSKIQRALPASQLFSAMPPLEAVTVLVSIMMSVSWSNKRKSLKMRHYDINRTHFQGTAQRIIYVRLPAEKIVRSVATTKLADLSRACMEPIRVGNDQTGQYFDIEPDLRHAPLSSVNQDAKTVSTPREKLKDKLVLDGRRSPILKKKDATRHRSSSMRLS